VYVSVGYEDGDKFEEMNAVKQKAAVEKKVAAAVPQPAQQ
jgi:hypothetical protein